MKGTGWLRMAIDWLDAAFPVTNRTRVDGGIDDGSGVGTPGGGPDFFAPCMKKWIPRPEEVDVWVLEFQPVMRCEYPQAVERIVRQALGSRGAAELPPALFLANFRMWCDRFGEKNFDVDAIDALCDSLPWYRINKDAKIGSKAVSATLTGWRDVRAGFEVSSGTDKYLEVLARRYGGASWSSGRGLPPLLNEMNPPAGPPPGST
eukprot:CAMPEP_0181348632 /NCGR_PEP_ID=MMETSP1106-20121128/284_1 /TAXON_ID=81844 /ORGANISM="Mantoniella antarctica, Strain SL-175" /LENGTH=204 /DNA_ID=CAMNT_0023460947 /DNA_START=117 /DNA_END=731 /DNA_ORIENTATION=+